MARSNTQIPEEFKSIEEIQNFWDQYSTADYWNQMEDVGFVADLYCVARIGSALVSSDDINVFAQIVDDLCFTFIAPLGANYHNNGHAASFPFI